MQCKTFEDNQHQRAGGPSCEPTSNVEAKYRPNQLKAYRQLNFHDRNMNKKLARRHLVLTTNSFPPLWHLLLQSLLNICRRLTHLQVS